jgi:hypothetical protein
MDEPTSPPPPSSSPTPSSPTADPTSSSPTADPTSSGQTGTDSRKAARSVEEKLDLLFQFLRSELCWSVSDVIKGLAVAKGPVNARRKLAFVRAAYEDVEILDLYLSNKPGAGKKQRETSRRTIIQYLDVGNGELREEVKKLATLKPFNSSHKTEQGFQQLNMEQIIQSAEAVSPLLLKTLRDISRPLRGSQKGVGSALEISGSVLTGILAVLCGTQQRTEASAFQLQLGIYMHSKGVKRRQLDVLHQLGLCCSYHKILQAISNQCDQSAAAVAQDGQQPTVVTAYDNFEQMEHVKEQRIDNQNSFHSVTTGVMVEGIEMPATGLAQNMLNSDVRLEVEDIFNAPGNTTDDLEGQVRCY